MWCMQKKEREKMENRRTGEIRMGIYGVCVFSTRTVLLLSISTGDS